MVTNAEVQELADRFGDPEKVAAHLVEQYGVPIMQAVDLAREATSGLALPPTDISGQPPVATPPTDISGQPLAAVHATYRRWLGARYDLGALDCVLSTAAAERLDGDPPWLLLVGGSGATKTETLMPLEGAGAVVISTITGEAGLLSATSDRDKSSKATGGLLRVIGDRGMLVLKDFTSILSMNRDTRAILLAALREIYDGHWTRNTGTDGGKTFIWRGRIVLIGACTTAWDAAHAVISAMGDRFVLVRIDSGDDRAAAGRQAMSNVGSEARMRAELREVVGTLISSVDPAAAITISAENIEILLSLADLVTRARTACERDFQGNPEFAHDLELPTRFAKQLVQIARGAVAIGMSWDGAIDVACRCARDTMPPLRRRILGFIARNPGSLLADVVKGLQLPRKTMDRALQELHLLGLLVVDDVPYIYGGEEKVRWAYRLAPAIDASVVQRVTARRSRPEMSEGGSEGRPEMSVGGNEEPPETAPPAAGWPADSIGADVNTARPTPLAMPKHTAGRKS